MILVVSFVVDSGDVVTTVVISSVVVGALVSVDPAEVVTRVVVFSVVVGAPAFFVIPNEQMLFQMASQWHFSRRSIYLR